MLQNIRDRMTGIVAGVIVGLLVITFGLWGIGSYFQTDADPVAVTVGDAELTASQVDRLGQNEYQNQLQNYERFRETNPNALIPSPDPVQARERAVEQWTARTVMQQYAAEQGFRFTDAQVAEAIRSNPQFQENGRFSSEQYNLVLAQQGNSPARYEFGVRQQGQLASLDAVLRQTALVTPSYDESIRRLAEQQRNVTLLTVEHNALRDAVEVSDSDLMAYYDEQKASLQTDAEAQVNYLVIDKQQLEIDTEIDSGVLQARYERDKDAYSSQERRKTRHILINKDTDNAQQKAEALAAELAGGADFAELAMENSEDPGSAAKGGELGWVTRGQMVEPFEEAMFALDAGELSDVVESRFGYHVIRVDEIEAASTKAFDDPEIQEELTNQILQQRRNEVYGDRIENLRQVAFELPDSLADVAQELNFVSEVQTTDVFTANRGTGIAAEASVRRAAFSPALVEENRNSEVIQLPGDRAVVLHMAEYKAPQTLAFEDVKAELREELITERAQQAAMAKSKALAEALRNGKTAAELAESEPAVSLSEPKSVGRDASDMPAAALRTVFRMPHPKAGGIEVATVELLNGDAAVVQLNEVVVPDAKVVEAEQQKNRQRGLASRLAQIEGSFLFSQLRETADVDIDQEAIESIGDR